MACRPSRRMLKGRGQCGFYSQSNRMRSRRISKSSTSVVVSCHFDGGSIKLQKPCECPSGCTFLWGGHCLPTEGEGGWGIPCCHSWAIREMAVRGSTGKRWITRSIPDRTPHWWTACYSDLTSQAGCYGRVPSTPFFAFFSSSFLCCRLALPAALRMSQEGLRNMAKGQLVKCLCSPWS